MGDQIRVQTPGDASGDADPAMRVDRRRPGRVGYTNPALLALLRRPKTSDAAAPVLAEVAADDVAHTGVPGPDWEQGNDSDDLAPFRGIMFGLLAVIPFWAGIARLCWWLFRR